MLNRYPLWKYLLILAIVVLGFFYASANLYKPDPAIQISGVSSSVEITSSIVKRATKVLEKNNIQFTEADVDEKSGNGLIRLANGEQQKDAQTLIKEVLRDDYVVALNLAPTTPEWLRNLGASPMKLGLDLSGGVHFLMEVDTDSVIRSHLETNENLIKSQLRDERLRYSSVTTTTDNQLIVKFREADLRNKAAGLLRSEYLDFIFESIDGNGEFIVQGTMLEERVKEIEDYAVNQNLTTLRNRVNELGVSEPIVQRQGGKRIVVELPGVQDTAQAKAIIGKTANLEFRLEAEPGGLASSRESFPYRSEETQAAFGNQWLEKRVVVTGESVTRAQASFDSQTGGSQVNIDLDSDGGAAMYKNTVNNVGRRLGVLFIEYKTKTFDARGKRLEKPEQIIEKRIISLATIQSGLNASFRITGLENSAEASELALLLRAGALAAPMQFVQESTIGPSLGAENIKLGVTSVQIGLLLVVLFMLVFYKVFGVAANIALAANLILLVAVMSLLGATLTLPGIAGIVLTVGMAVDANVLIFSRIKEELKNGLSPQYAINSGFDRAFTTILDANLTTLIVAVILYGIGTGPVKGFAVTLAIGILTSMFTAILGTRAVINLIYGGRTVKKLWI